MLDDSNIALPNDTEAASRDERFKAPQSVRKEAAMAVSGRIFKDKNPRDELVQSHKFQERAIAIVLRASAKVRI